MIKLLVYYRLVQKGCRVSQKVLNSAVANAVYNLAMDTDNLFVSAICVDEGPTFKRMHARAKGRGNRILKGHATLWWKCLLRLGVDEWVKKLIP